MLKSCRKIVTDEFYLDSIHKNKINVLNIHAYITRQTTLTFDGLINLDIPLGTK